MIGLDVQNSCLDFSKAFDRLQHSILIEIMENHGFNRNIILLVEDFLANRVQCVKHNGVFSNYESVAVGTPQSTKLGPILWLIYCNDLNADGFSKVQYADDTTIYTPVKHPNHSVANGIQQASDWSVANNMQLNHDKTVILNVAFSERKGIDDPVKYLDTDILPSKSAKFLGVTIDRTLTFFKSY